MKKRLLFILLLVLPVTFLKAQVKKKGVLSRDTIAPVGVIKGLSDSALMDVVQRQTFRFFWHGAHPVSGLALERSNTVLAEHYWDYINEA